jgi:hypothetical protein
MTQMAQPTFKIRAAQLGQLRCFGCLAMPEHYWNRIGHTASRA